MTFVIATLGSAGDLHPFLAVARALHEQGESVLMLAPEPHRTQVQAQGVAFEAILSTADHERTIAHPSLWHPIRGFGVLWRYMAVPAIDPTWKILQRLSRNSSQPIRVFASPLVVGARLAQELLPLKLTTGHTAPMGLRSCADPMFIGSTPIPSWLPYPLRKYLWHALDRYKLQPMAAPKLDIWRTEHSLAPLDQAIFDRWIHSPQQVIGMFPTNFGPMPKDWPVNVHLTGFPLYEEHLPDCSADPELSVFCQSNSDTPLVVFFPGSAAKGQHAVMQASAAQLASSGQFRCLWIGQSLHSQPDPALLQRSWVQLSQVLAHAKVFVHHGGIGCCAQGLNTKLAQIILPAAYDQFDNGARIAAMHAGTWLAPKHQNTKMLTRTIKYWSQQATQHLQGESISSPSHPNQAVQKICQHLRAN